MIQRRRHMRVIDIPGSDADCKETDDIKLKVAFATVGMLEVNQHFGLAEGFVIYEIIAQESVMLEAAGFDQQKKYNPGHSDDKLADKIELIKDCVAMYCTAVGPRAVSRLMESGIHPVKVDEGTSIKTIIHDMQNKMANDELPAWVKRIMAKKTENRDKELEKLFDMEWQEV